MSEENNEVEIQRIEKDIQADQEGLLAIDLLANAVPLSRQKLKQTMQKGGIWLKKAQGGRRRLRRAKTQLEKDDVLELRYDAHILSAIAPVPHLIADKKHYSVWFKPENLLSQGSKFADHCAITRWVEKNHLPRRAVYLVHRLDRAASGLILLAHDQKTAAKLSKLFSDRRIEKRYKVCVEGVYDGRLPMKINSALDGKEAESIILEANASKTQTELIVEIKTGRKHQIRRHLNELGFPVQGDKIYGAGTDKIESSMQLVASYLSFVCPVSNKRVTYQLEE